VAWGIRNAARVVPEATCFVQALAAQFLLARSGTPSQIRIGVAAGPGGEFVAHAWLLTDGRVVVGGSASELRRYTVLTDLHSATNP
jgi:Transglutaminase-like superfamily